MKSESTTPSLPHLNTLLQLLITIRIGTAKPNTNFAIIKVLIMEGNIENSVLINDLKTDRNRNRLEINNTLILSIATLAITWCSYQSNLWNGIQTFYLAESNKFSRSAQQQALQSGQRRQMDEAIIISFFNEAFSKNEDKIKYILRGVRPELSKIMSDWRQLHPFENPSAPFHPMAMPGYKELIEKDMAESDELRSKSEQSFEKATWANTVSDRYSLLTVIFSMVMFLAAIGAKVTRIRLSFTLFIVSGLVCIGVLILLFLYMPIASK